MKKQSIVQFVMVLWIIIVRFVIKSFLVLNFSKIMSLTDWKEYHRQQNALSAIDLIFQLNAVY